MKKMLGMESSSDRFYAEAPGLDPILTSVEGVFLAGCCQGPKDIPDTVAQASGASALACAILAKGRKQQVRSSPACTKPASRSLAEGRRSGEGRE